MSVVLLVPVKTETKKKQVTQLIDVFLLLLFNRQASGRRNIQQIILWMVAKSISHHLRNPGMVIPL